MMMNTIEQHIASVPLVPLIQSNDPVIAIETTKALVAGGLSVIEVVLRTPEALNCLSAIVQVVPEALVGAGTVLNTRQAEAAIMAGAEFIVCPGLHKPVIDVVKVHGLPVFPGVVTATEMQQAWNMGLRTLKFFPAELAGGTALIKSLAAVFSDVKFIPTGGISADNLAEYLSVPAVLACGGSWLTPKTALASGDFEVITELAAAAVAIAVATRG